MLFRCALFVFAALTILPSCSGAPRKAQLAKEAAEYVSKRYSLQLSKEALDGLTRQIEALAVKYGDEAFSAVRNVGLEALSLTGAAEQHAAKSIHLIAKYGRSALPIIKEERRLMITALHGDDAAEAMMKHAGIEPLLLAHGRPAVSAFHAVSPQGGRSLLLMAEKGELVQLGKTSEVLAVIAKYGDPAVEYIWSNKGKLVAAAALSAFLASPETHIQRVNTRFEIIHKGGRDDIRKLIIFVHGLGGDGVNSFAASRDHLPWPTLMAGDPVLMVNGWSLSDYTIGVLEYPAGPRDRLSIPEIGQKVSSELRGVSDSYAEIFFVAYSLGGIVVKRTLTSSSFGNEKLTDRTRGVFLISVPSNGTPLANLFGSIVRVFFGRIVAELGTISTTAVLQAVQIDWHNLVEKRKAHGGPLWVFCAYETQETKPIGVLVPLEYTDTACVGGAYPLVADHISAPKPPTRDSDVYKWVRAGFDQIGREHPR